MTEREMSRQALFDWHEYCNECFKNGRRAGQKDVAKEILSNDTASAHGIALGFLESHGAGKRSVK